MFAEPHEVTDRKRFCRLARRGMIPEDAVEVCVTLAAALRRARAVLGSDGAVFEAVGEVSHRPSFENWANSGRYRMAT